MTCEQDERIVRQVTTQCVCVCVATSLLGWVELICLASVQNIPGSY